MANKKFQTNATFNGEIEATKLKAATVGGDEGGELFLGKPDTNTTLAGGITVDVFQNKLRFFEQGGDARGYYLDITGGGGGASTNIIGGGSASDSFKTISVTGQDNVVADSSTDTLSLIAGTNVSITTNSTADSITINADSKATSSVYLVRNNTGSTILKGTLVSASGAEPSGRIDVEPFAAVGGINSELTVMGMATTNISNGVNGEVISFGTLTGLDTRGDTTSAIAVGDETWAAGDILFAHPTVAGKLTNVRPQHDLAVAFITVRHASTGQIAVRIVPGNNHLEWMHDVLIDTPADNEVLAYNSGSGLWINQTAGEAGLLDTSATAQTKAGDLTVSTKVVTPRIENTADINIVSDAGSGSSNDISLATRYNTVRISDTSSAVFIDAGDSLGYGIWKFDKTLILFPDNSSQSTAFLGMSSYSTTNLSEGTNLYYTDERAQDAIGTILGSGLSYNDSTGAISNSGVLDVIGTTNEIVITGTNTQLQVGIPDSPVFVTPNIGVATATSINGTTIPTSKTLVDLNTSQTLESKKLVGSSYNSNVVDVSDYTLLIQSAIYGVEIKTGSDNVNTKSWYFGTDWNTTFPGNIIFEGSTANDYEVTLAITDPTADRTITIPDDSGTISLTSHNHTLDSLSNVVITGTPTDGQAIVWDTTTSKWVNETVSGGGASYPTQSGNTGKFLQTDGSTVSWQNVDLSGYQPLDQDLTDIAALTANGFLKKTSGVWAMDTSTYLTSESDTFETVTDRGATSTNSITISNTTQSTTPTTGALIVSGGVGIAKDVWIDGNLHVNGTTITENTQTVATHDNLIYLNAAQDSTITNAVGDGTYVTYTADNKYTPGMDIRVTGMNPAGYNIASSDNLTVYSATSTQFVVAKTTTGTFVSGGTAHAKEEANPDLGFAGGYYNAGYAHAGLFRDATDGVFKFFDGYTPEPDEAVNIDTTHASFELADISANDATFTGNVTIGEAVVKTTSTNLVSSSATVIATIPIPSGKEVVSAECLVLLSSTYDGTYYTSKCLIFGGYPAGDSIADITEYAIMGDMDATLTAARVGSNVELSVQVTDYTNITAKVVSTSIAADNGAT